MLASELIQEIQKIIDVQGDGEIVIDIPCSNEYIDSIFVEGKFYTGNYPSLYVGKGRKPYVFIGVDEKEK